MKKEQRTYTLGGVFSPKAKSEIENTLTEMKSLQGVELDLTSKKVSFQFEPEHISEDFIRHTLNSLGYSVQSTY